MIRQDENVSDDCAMDVRAPARSSSAANLPVVEESDAAGEVGDLFKRYREHFGRPKVPGILKCFATHPVLLRSMMSLAENLLFVDGFLSRRHKELIATLVSTENACPYCADSHGSSFRTVGGSADQLEAIEARDLNSIAFTPEEKALMAFVDKVTRASHTIHRNDIENLIEAGWSEPQIAETIHIAALFAAFNRIVNAFGLPSQHLLDHYSPQYGNAEFAPERESRNSK